MNGQNIMPLAGLSSNILDDHLSKANDRWGFTGGFGNQLSFQPNPKLGCPDRDVSNKRKENEVNGDSFHQIFDQNKDELSTRFATTHKSGCTGHSFVPKISCSGN